MAEEKDIQAENQSVNPSEGAQAASGQNVTDISAKKEVEEYKAQAEKFKNEYLYLRAEFENYKKNAIKERSELSKYGSERIVVEVLNVIDNFERAQEAQVTPENLNNYVQGVKMTGAELKSLVQKFGVSEVAAIGLPFDPMVHEALGAEETNTVQEGYVFKVFKKAYKLHDRMIRPAQVIVAKAVTKSN